MKVKTISGITSDRFDIKINKFIKHKHIMDIKFTIDEHFHALIIYEEDN